MTTITNQKKDRQLVPREPEFRGVQPVKFTVWLLIIASIMFFGAITSAIIVRSADGVWAKFDLPNYFYISTVIVILSSLTMQLAQINAKRDEIGLVKLFTTLTFLLGVAFIGFNYMGWMALSEKGFALSNDIAGGQSASFFHFATYVHAAHVLIGLALLTATLIQAFRFKVHRKDMLLINISTTFWHFVDLLWIYLILFLILSL